MHFDRLSYEALNSELRPIPASGTDATTEKTATLVDSMIDLLQKATSDQAVIALLTELLGQDADYLDVLRLFAGVSQDTFAHQLGAILNKAGNYSQIKRIVKGNPAEATQAVVELGLVDTMLAMIQRQWTLADLLMERYHMSRGRALAGQQRGRFLEDQVAAILKHLNIPYRRGCTFTGLEGKTAKADFAIPNEQRPKIVIEVKGFEATGSKQTDVLGDIGKIGAARTPHMYVFVVTDGRGWLNRSSDLRELVSRHHRGDIDMIFTMARLSDLSQALQQIYEREM